ncbi:hypothetical protein SLEP1_g16914 [Rubroshorea leprosula]|uniref:Uncharacterized protein n=1 Tax=Rubroshorea leprosula TaxID=152421 RepID=A0AAV5ISF3_9ROSI|nr:hypothetical protein SLEP1_g16914 [Rubroshorea leprosula]
MLMRRRSRYVTFTFGRERITLLTQMQRPGGLNFDLHLAFMSMPRPTCMAASWLALRS